MAFSVWPSLLPLAAELTPEFTNLVSVVPGQFSKANREIAFNEATRLNQLSAPGSELTAGKLEERSLAL